MQSRQPTSPTAVGGPQLLQRAIGKAPSAEPAAAIARREADAMTDPGAIEYASWLRLLRLLRA